MILRALHKSIIGKFISQNILLLKEIFTYLQFTMHIFIFRLYVSCFEQNQLLAAIYCAKLNAEMVINPDILYAQNYFFQYCTRVRSQIVCDTLLLWGENFTFFIREPNFFLRFAKFLFCHDQFHILIFSSKFSALDIYVR